jgi:hypothetical protein
MHPPRTGDGGGASEKRIRIIPSSIAPYKY